MADGRALHRDPQHLLFLAGAASGTRQGHGCRVPNSRLRHPLGSPGAGREGHARNARVDAQRIPGAVRPPGGTRRKKTRVLAGFSVVVALGWTLVWWRRRPPNRQHWRGFQPVARNCAPRCAPRRGVLPALPRGEIRRLSEPSTLVDQVSVRIAGGGALERGPEVGGADAFVRVLGVAAIPGNKVRRPAFHPTGVDQVTRRPGEGQQHKPEEDENLWVRWLQLDLQRM
jgi:hypothetical protein